MSTRQVTYLIALVSVCVTAACGVSDVAPPTTFTDQLATLEVVSCSRGCEQYVLRTDNSDAVPLYVMNMPDSLKIRTAQSAYVNNQLPVIFSGTRLDEMQQISVSAPTDGSIPAYKAYRLRLTAIRRR